MSLLEIEQRIIQPLSRAEKLQLIADITKMLQEEDERLRLKEIVQADAVYEVYSPQDCDEAAVQLQKYLEDEYQTEQSTKPGNFWQAVQHFRQEYAAELLELDDVFNDLRQKDSGRIPSF